MAANHYIPGAVPAKLDDTADYPPLPESYAVPGAPPPPPALPHATDTWVMPSLVAEPEPTPDPVPPSVPGPSTEELLRPLREECMQLRAELAQLQGGSAAIASELDMRADEARSAVDKLRASEARTLELEARLRAAEAECSQLRAHGEAERSELRTKADGERARRESVLAHNQEELSELHTRLAAHGEALRRVEGQRHVFDAQLREREAMLDEAHAALREHAEARERIEAGLAAAIARAEKAEQRLAERLVPSITASPAAPAAPTASVSSASSAPEATAAQGVDPELPDRLASLEAELADNRAQLDSLRQKLSGAQQTERALRTELDNRARATSAGAALPWPAAEDEPTIASSAVTGIAGAAPMVESEFLLVRTTGEVGIVHVLGRRTTIGRTPDNDLRVEADHVSRHHCVVLISPDHAIVEDLNSTNGVYVNGARVMRRELREGDLITIGETTFRYVRKPAQSHSHEPA